MNHNLNIAYIIDSFPLLSETFILNEIIELKNSNIDVSIISIFYPKQSIMHTEATRLVKSTYYLRKFDNLSQIFKKLCKIIYANLSMLIRYPSVYMQTFRFICTLHDYKIFPRFWIASHLALLLRKMQVGHIHAHFARLASEYAMLVSMLSGIPYSFTVHAYDLFISPRLLDKKIDLASFVISKTQYNKRFLKNNYRYIDLNKIYVINYGIDIKKFSFSQNNTIGNKSFNIVIIARLIEKKGHKYLFEALKKLNDRGIFSLECKIIGDGPLKNKLESLALRLGLSHILQFMGSLSSEDIRPILNDCDLFVLPCIVAQNGDMDGMPNVLIEAMALEKPVISSHISGIPELVRGESGILVPPKDSNSLANAIERVYYMSLNERRRMGYQGRQIVKEEFNIYHEIARTKDLFIKFSLKFYNK